MKQFFILIVKTFTQIVIPIFGKYHIPIFGKYHTGGDDEIEIGSTIILLSNKNSQTCTLMNSKTISTTKL